VLPAAVIAFGLIGAGVASPASAAAPAAKKAGGTAVVILGNGCSATLVGPGKQKTSRKVPARGVLKKLSPGTYTLKVKPKNCKAEKAKVRVKKGKRVTVEVFSDPKLVSTSFTGSFSGTESGPGVQASWNGEITLSLSSVGSASFPLFPQLAQYRVTAASGSWTISGVVPGGCSYSGGGALSLDDFGVDNGNLWMNPWNNNTYAFEAMANTAKSWPYVATCPTDEGSEVRNESRPLPFRLLASNRWSGIDPEPPLPTGGNPSGTYTWPQGAGSTTWTWDLGSDLSKTYSKP
jgi:hypothetical protein